MENEKFHAVKDTIYLSLKRNAVIESSTVHIADIAEVYCAKKDVQNRIQKMAIQRLNNKETKVISALYVIEQIQKECPGKFVSSLGENDVIVSVKKKRDNKIVTVIKIGFVSLVLFFGTAFTIMAFHGDIGIEEMFGKIYRQMTGQVSDGTTILEFSYTIGIVVGILLFFNHISGKKVTPEPTPVQVQLRDYEIKMDQAFVENVDRKGSEESVK